ncbi:MAG: AAA family ATPase, partial [Saprospiraceae bacterium]
MDSIFDCFPNISPTATQKQALFQLSMFPQSEKRIFILKGYAGTGKTTLLEGLIQFYKKRKIPVVCMAPTGRAARILAHKTKAEAGTIHTTIYKRKPIDFSKDDLNIEFFINPDTPEDGTIGIIDEASMVSDFEQKNAEEGLKFGTGKLLSDVFSFFGMSENKKSKLIFIGDGAQLAPVGHPVSVALQKDYIQKTFDLPVMETELTEVMRHDNLILSAATHVRNKITKGIFDSYHPPTGPEVMQVDHRNLVSYYLRQFRDVHASRNGILIANSNKKALEYNKLVRYKFFPDHHDMVQSGDRLIVSANNYL